MDRIGIKNLRSLNNIQDIEIRPITVLVGKNSSGKSTFLRTFPLLKQTIETRTSVPILWYGNYVDFGDFKESLCRTTTENYIEFDFEFNIPQYSFNNGSGMKYYGARRLFTAKEKLNIKTNIALNEDFVQSMIINFGDQLIKLEYKSNGTISRLKINNSEFDMNDYEWSKMPTSLIPKIDDKTQGDVSITFPYLKVFSDNIIDSLMKNAHQGTKRHTIEVALNTLVLGNQVDVCDSFKNNTHFPSYLHDRLMELTINSEYFQELNNLFVALNLRYILDVCNTLIENTAGAVKYIKPVRANIDRYYRIQGLYIDEIDASGQNMPMFLHNLSEQDKENFQSWSKEMFNIVFSTISKEGHVSLIMKDWTTGENYNLADTGFGFSQILPIIVLLWQASKKKIKKISPVKFYSAQFVKSTLNYLVVIEQPELHLHPAFQAKIVDIFARIVSEANKKYKSHIKIIFETHSETMINRLGYLIAKNKFNKEHVNVLIFDKNENQETIIKSVEYSEKGMLQGWPLGFFAPEQI